MPTYEYRCEDCKKVTEIIHSIKESPVFECQECLKIDKHIVLERLISFGAGFIFKQWTESMAWKTKRDKAHANNELGVKQIERYAGGPSLQPNVAGMEVDSWSEAQKVAKEAGMRPETYEPLIEKEKRVSKISGVDDTKWKAAKSDAGKI